MIARGNNRQAIFLSPADREQFEHLLRDGADRFGHSYHALCLMTNHVHLMTEIAEVPLSQIAHNLLFRYARWFHHKYDRSGHLFERRFRAYRVDTDEALLCMVRYIHLNPVRGGLTNDPSSYRWSSHRDYLGEGGRDWLVTDFVLSLFGPSQEAARAAYRSFIAEADGEEESGSDAHGEQLVARPPQASRRPESSLTPSPSLPRLLDTVCRALSVTPTELRADTQRRHITRARAVAALLVQNDPILTLEELGRIVGRDASTLSRAASNLERRRGKDRGLRKLVRTIEAELGAD